MRKLKVILVFMLSSFLLDFSFAIVISPLKFELKLDPGQTVEKVIKITNNEKWSITLYVSKEDFVAWDETWKPKFVKPKDNKTNYWLSRWIEVEQQSITLAKWETREVRFKIQIPEDWEPGWHYGAIFFSPWPGKWNVGIIPRIWVLLLVDVNWEVIMDWKLTKYEVWKKTKTSFQKETIFSSLPVDFLIEFKNNWNVHIKPQWKIMIFDENWNQLKNIWKEKLVSKQGVLLWEKMVDYIPVNDKQWNVLPWQARKFFSTWKWFWYQVLNPDGTRTVKFYSLQEWIDKKDAENKKYLKFYETVQKVNVKKKFTADLNLYYIWKDWEKKEFKQSKDFYVSYVTDKVVINKVLLWGVWLWLLLVIVLFVYYNKSSKKKMEEMLKQKLLEELKNKDEK